ncbi:MAG TPA: 4-alpha-glucanotransferase [Casimicrobiaceae bacterium]|nr:4-alpha-glucanotransferase [Casimicrobiaceae bacterium]
MDSLERLARAYGIALTYYDIFGTQHEVSTETLRALLAAMNVDASSDERVARALATWRNEMWRARLPAMIVLPPTQRPWIVTLHLPRGEDSGTLAILIRTEAGETHRLEAGGDEPRETARIDNAEWIARDLAIDCELPLGYHELAVHAGERCVASVTCAVTPARCHRPEALRRGGLAFGTTLQLYGLRSKRNFGIGDFTDLADCVDRSAAQGASVVGVNPLHALFPHNPLHTSPYSPSSRLFANVLYLDVEAIDEFAVCEPARKLVSSRSFQDRVQNLRDATLVDYSGIAAAKNEVLEVLFACFIARRNPDRFTAFKRQRGEALRLHALFEALQERFHREDAGVWGWPAWPQRFHDPRSAAVARFAQKHAERVDFYAWLQWQADLQRASVATRARDRGMLIGLYTDLAVSIDRGGAESWALQHLYANGASVGAPPDAFNADGQNWGLPPIVPARLVAAGYAPFIATLRANMRHAGALRIDHVMGLLRLFWIPSGARPKDGAYVQYPFEDLLSLLALESERHRCLVIGEDLGTVPDEVRAALLTHDVMSYRVLMFERDDSGAFKPPDAYPEGALATAGTHDLPTLAGWWAGVDIDTRTSLGIFNAEQGNHERRQRADDRSRLVEALRRAGLLPVGEHADSPHLTAPLARAILAFLAQTPCVLTVVQLDDALRVREQANLPGTVDEHPNWRRKLPLDTDGIFADADVQALFARLRKLRAPLA